LINFNERYRIYPGVVGGALLILLLFIWFQNIFSGEEGRIRKFILQGKRAAEARDILACAAMISTRYQDKYGNDRQNLIYSAKEFFNYYRQIFVNIESMEIEIDDTKMQASVEIMALVVGQTQESKSEKILEGEKGRFRIRLVKEDKKWHLLELEFFEPVTIMGQEIS
jgi:hypothetical protein